MLLVESVYYCTFYPSALKLHLLQIISNPGSARWKTTARALPYPGWRKSILGCAFACPAIEGRGVTTQVSRS